MLRHSSGWFTTMAVAIRYAGTRLHDDSPARWTRISASRIVAFVLLVSCVLLDCTRFVDTAVNELTGHCFAGVSLWTHNVTQFSVRPFYADIQPTVSVVAGQLVPFVLTLLFTTLLFVGHLRCRCCRSVARHISVTLRVPADHDEREYQLSFTVFAVSLAFLCLDSLTTAVDITHVSLFLFRPNTNNSNMATGSSDDVTVAVLRYLQQIGRCTSLIRCAVNFVIIVLYSHDFRKTLRRMFCCCCPSEDDVYYEPVTCCSCCCRRQRRSCVNAVKDKPDWSGPDRITTRTSMGACSRDRRRIDVERLDRVPQSETDAFRLYSTPYTNGRHGSKSLDNFGARPQDDEQMALWI